MSRSHFEGTQAMYHMVHPRKGLSCTFRMPKPIPFGLCMASPSALNVVRSMPWSIPKAFWSCVLVSPASSNALFRTHPERHDCSVTQCVQDSCKHCSPSPPPFPALLLCESHSIAGARAVGEQEVYRSR